MGVAAGDGPREVSGGLVIFAATCLLIAVQRLPFIHLNRPTASLLGAVAMVVFGVVSLEQVYAALDFDVLVFLPGLVMFGVAVGAWLAGARSRWWRSPAAP